ncbi:Acetokinase family-domain-containing protein [Baffinella frigidus]|nr:Acetokinase family-domain-containing protein [Cryptophyta sp. CCMP2293]
MRFQVVGHRVVHGADRFSKATVITPDVELAIQDAARLAPLHNPANLLGIREAMKVFSCPHVAVFDTAFHTTMPPESYTYAIPLDLAAKHKIRKYGFHGTSYGFVMQQTAERLGKRAEDLNAIICHLGNGASMSCIRKGVCVDTTMGLTPLEGLVMGTRSGDVDPGVYTYLTQDMSPAEVDNLLNKASGLKGLCGHSDMQQVIVAADAGEENAQLALKVFRVRKYLGSYLVRLNGEVDAVVFTAGIGEHSAKVRTLACEGLETLGIALDPAKNAHVSRSAGGVISAAHSHTKILVVPTDEELAICLQSYEAAGLLNP